MTLQLKCQLPTGKTTTTRFPLSLTIGELKQQIINDTQTGGPDHSIFLPPIPMVRNGLWLQDDRTINFYDLKTGDLIALRKRTAPKKFMFEDQTQKVILIDESLPVRAIIEQVLGEHMSITNPEEFGMVVEGAGRDDWLDTKTPIAQQGVPDDSVLCIRKRFWYNDANIDTTDPMQLHLLYLQINTQVLEGQHPMTLEEAIALAALQCQIQHGNYDAKQYPAGYLASKLHTLLSSQHFNPKKDKKSTLKSLESEIFREWRKHVKLSAVNAKYRYSQLVRALPTWGIVYYPCQEPIPGDKKGKLRDVLIGVNRDSVVYADPKTFERLKTLPLTKIKRWSPSSTTITIDCGDHEADYFRAFTPHAEKICQMLHGYIEIILAKKMVGQKPTAISDTKVANAVAITPKHGIAVESHIMSRAGGGMGMQGGQFSNQGDGANPYGWDSSRQGQASSSGDPMGAGGSAYDGNQFLITDFNSAIQGLQLLPMSSGAPLAHEYEIMSMDNAMQTYSMAYAGVLKGVEYFGNPASMNPDDMASLGKYLHDNLAAMINAAKRAAAEGGSNVSLLDGAFGLSQAVSKVLQCARDIKNNPDDAAAQLQWQQAGQIYSAASFAVQALQASLHCDRPSEDWILGSASLSVERALRFANDCDVVPGSQGSAGSLRDQAALLSAAASALARGVLDPRCRDALSELVQTLYAQAGQLVQTAQLNRSQMGEAELQALMKSAAALTQALNLLKEVCATSPQLAQHAQLLASPLLTTAVSNAGESVGSLLQQLASTSDVAVLTAGAKAVEARIEEVAQVLMSVATLVPGQRDALVGSAHAVAEASASVKGFIEQGNSPNALQWGKHLAGLLSQLGLTAENLRSYGILLEQSKIIAGCLSSSAAIATAARVSDPRLGEQLSLEITAACDALLGLAPAVQLFQADPSAPVAQKTLYTAARATALPASRLVAAGLQALPSLVVDHQQQASFKATLSDSCNATSAALQRLLEACDDVSSRFGGKEFGESEQAVQQSLAQLNSLIIQAQSGALPRDTVDDNQPQYEALRNTLLAMTKALKEVQRAAVEDQDAVGIAAKTMAEQIAKLPIDSRALAETYPERAAQQTLLAGAKNVAQQSADFLVSVRGVLTDPSPQLYKELEDTTRNISQAVANLIGAARSAGTGAGEECGKAAEAVRAAMLAGNNNSAALAGANVPFIEAARQTRTAVGELQGALGQVSTLATTDPKGLALAAGSTGTVFPSFVSSGRLAQAVAPTPQLGATVGQLIEKTSEYTTAALTSARSAKVDAQAAAALRAATGNAMKSLELLLNALDDGIPGKPQVQQAILIIEESLSARAKDATGPTSVAEMSRASRALGMSVGKVVAAVRTSPEAAAAHAVSAADQARSIVFCSKQLQGLSAEIRSLLDVAREVSRTASSVDQEGDDESGTKNKLLVAQCRQLLQVGTELFAELRSLSSQPDYVGNVDALSEAVKLLVSVVSAVDKRELRAKKLPAVLGALESRGEALRAKVLTLQGLESAVELSAAGLTTAQGLLALLRIVAQLCDDPADATARGALVGAQRDAAVALRTLTTAAAALAPAQRECDSAVQTANSLLEELEAIDFEILSGVAGGRRPSRPGLEHEEYAQALVRTAHALEAACMAAGGDPGNAQLGQLVLAVQAVLPRFAEDTKDAVFSSSGELQSDRLQLSKSIGEHVVGMLAALKKAAVDSEDMDAAQRLGTELSNIGRAVNTLSGRLQSTRLLLAECDNAAEAVRTATTTTLASAAAAKAPTTVTRAGDDGAALGYQRSVQQLAEAGNGFKTALNNLAKAAAEDTSSLGELSTQLAARFVEGVVPSSGQCAASISQAPLRQGVITATANMGRCAVAVFEACKQVAVDPADVEKQQTLTARVRDARGAIIELVNAAKAGATGAKACEQAAADIGEVVQKIDADYLYAAAGQMDVSDVDSSVPLADCHGDTLTSLQQMGQLVQSLSVSQKVGGGGAGVVGTAITSQDQLGTNATQVAALVKRVAIASKTVAAILSDIATQQHILQAVKQLALSSQNVVLSAKRLHDDPTNPAARELSALSLAKHVSDHEALVTVVNSSSADIIQSHKELDGAKARVNAALQRVQTAPATGAKTSVQGPEDIVVSLRQIAKNTADIVSASASSHEGLIQVARSMASSAEALTEQVLGALQLAPNDQATQQSLRGAAGTNASRIVALLEAIRLQRADDPQSFLRVSEASSRLADSLHETVVAARRLPGGEHLELEENDLGAMAEKELLAAAEAIDKAAAKLLRLPKRQDRAPDDEGLMDEQDIAEAIIGSARAITDATRALVQSATSVQRELAAAGKVNPHLNVYKKDPAWAMGLISAAQAVSGSVEDLVESANNCAKAEADEENEARLIAAVMMVGGATARLVAASRVKADPNSPSQGRLENAAKAVAAATKRLSEAARSRDQAPAAAAAASAAAPSEATLNAVQRRRLEFEKQVEIERLRKQLEVAQQGVFSMRKEDYGGGAASSSRAASSRRQ